MDIEHIVSESDTIEGIAERYLDDSSLWTTLVDYNNLDYPYIVTDPNDKSIMYADTYITVTRGNTSSSLTILAGSVFKTRIDNQGAIKSYTATEDTTIASGASVGYVHVQCTVVGYYGNTLANTIVDGSGIKTNIGTYAGDLTITNDSPVTNGYLRNVKTLGESIYIPGDLVATNVTDAVDVTNFLNALGGEDIGVDANQLLYWDGLGDIGTVVGLANIEQALTNRLMTEKGSDPANPEYGTGIAELLGTAQTDNRLKLIELEVYDALSYEDRIVDATVASVTVDGTSVYVTINIPMGSAINSSLTQQTINLTLDY